jgi:hypothetical protein
MEQNLENKIELKDKLFRYYNHNKKKIYIFLFVLLIIVISIILLQQKSEKKNILNAEKYIQAGLYLTSNNKNEAILLYEEIILSKNEIYAILALNTVVEKKLISDKKRILELFMILENSTKVKENKDLIKLKKALYLIKISKIEDGKSLLKDLIEKNSNFKAIAQDLLEK